MAKENEAAGEKHSRGGQSAPTTGAESAEASQKAASGTTTQPGGTHPAAGDEAAQPEDAGQGLTENDGADDGSPGGKQESKKKPFSLKRFLIKWSILLLLVIVGGAFTYRWAGTTVYRGTIQKVYEKDAVFRVEFAELHGTVHVLENREIRYFPYNKLATADLQADLRHLAGTGDVVDLRVWGFRQATFDSYPNAVDFELVMSKQARERKRAEVVAQRVVKTLHDRGLLKGGADVLPEIAKVVEETLRKEESSRPGDSMDEKEDGDDTPSGE